MAFIALGAAISSADTALVPMGDSKTDETKLKKHKPVKCTATKDVVLDGVIIEAKGPAATLMGACDITIKNSVIRTSETAIQLMGSGDIILSNTTVETKGTAVSLAGSGDVQVTDSRISGKVAVSIDGSGDLVATNSQFRGKKVIRGTGEYQDKGGNKWEKKK